MTLNSGKAFSGASIFAKKKLSKSDLDVEFLKACKTYDIFPKFLRFKLYRPSLRTSEAYNFQGELLDIELNLKFERSALLNKEYVKLRDQIQNGLAFFEFRMFTLHENEIVHSFITKNKKTHRKKLQRLGIYNNLTPCDPDRVFHNLSSKNVPRRIKALLAFCLDFRLPVWKIDFFRYYLSFEKMLNVLTGSPLRSNLSFDHVGAMLPRFASTTFESVFTHI